MDVQQTHFSVSRQQQQQNSASCSECEGTDKQTGHVFQERRLIPRRTFYTNRFHLYIGVVHETRWTSGLAAADNYTINRQTQPRRWRKPAHAAIPWRLRSRGTGVLVGQAVLAASTETIKPTSGASRPNRPSRLRGRKATWKHLGLQWAGLAKR